ncbi:nuclear transport factor 2 family protein [Actinoplanes sp. NPDC026619]|uniref:nuclear transport factor 2 family protein n=1 Tax=Actinoplanes sp. NPDC026619 TaxID=3155798 RepID=UPI0033DB036F
MPWFPDFAAAAELMRRETRAAEQADPVGQYLTALNDGDAHALEDVWPGQVVIFDPKAGEVRGHRELRKFLRTSRDLLARRRASTEIVAATTAGGRAVVELMAQLDDGVRWPVAVVAESPDDRTVVFRTYFSRHPLDGRSHLRPAILEPAPLVPGDVAGRFQEAVAAGDVAGTVRLFAPDGYLRDPLDGTYRGAADLDAYFCRIFAAGGPGIETCVVTDDGVRCALEQTFVRWGGRELPPQAGLVVHERDTTGLLAAVRVYDDFQLPAELTR